MLWHLLSVSLHRLVAFYAHTQDEGCLFHLLRRAFCNGRKHISRYGSRSGDLPFGGLIKQLLLRSDLMGHRIDETDLRMQCRKGGADKDGNQEMFLHSINGFTSANIRFFPGFHTVRREFLVILLPQRRCILVQSAITF